MRTTTSASIVLSSIVLIACGAPQTPPPTVSTAAPPPSASAPQPEPAIDAGPTAELDAAAAHQPPRSGGGEDQHAAPPEPAINYTVLKKGMNATSAMTADGNAIYWIEVGDNTLSRVSKRGGATNLLYTASAPNRLDGSALVVDGADAYWAETTEAQAPANAAPGAAPTFATIQKQDKNGGSASAVASRVAGYGHALAVDEQAVYWLAGDAIWRAPKKGGLPQPLTTKLADAPTSVASDGKHVYWTTATSVMRMTPRLGSKQEVFAKDQDKPTDLMVDADDAYWRAGSKIMEATKAKPEPKPIAQADGTIADYTIDGAGVYWVGQDASGDGVVMRVAKTGGAPEKLASHQPQPIAIAVDRANVYWATKGTEAAKFHDGALVALPK